MSAGACAVLSGAAIAADDGSWRPLPVPWGWPAVYVAAVELGVSSVLVVDVGGWDGGESAGGLTIESWAEEGEGAPWLFTLSTAAAFLCGGGAPGRVGGQVVHVAIVPRAGGLAGPWEGLGPRELVDVLTQLRRLLRVSWAFSPGSTAERLIRSTHPPARGGRQLDDEPATPAVCEQGGLEVPWFRWRRERTRDERAAGWVHVFDANAQYLAAWQAAELGAGRAVHQLRPRFDANTVGVWRIEGGLDAVPAPAFPLLPAPWIEGREWYTTPTMRRALEVTAGFDFPDVAEAWVWPDRSRYLRGAGERLRDARSAALVEQDRARAGLSGPLSDEQAAADLVRRMVAASSVVDAVKAVYARQTGRFNMAARSTASPWRRPDWGHTLRATARVNLHRRLATMTAAPFAIATDALAFCTTEPDWRAFANLNRVPIGTGLGAFKHAGTARAEDVDGLDELAGNQLMQAIGQGMT